ncbi:hypothetical protein HF521_017028 [Silurus meridionalis]|uniref:Uncharacterized protein n=1 Tax=Silurus meridionalis TaxID=175797 RepID=A0A8T0BL20_SILME|nr:hypothetical protein HF521_017028 [Silurus meridionalis]
MKSDDLKRVELRLQTADGLLRRNISTTREIKMNSSISALYVGDLHHEVTENMLMEKFSSVGHVHSIRICRNWNTGVSLSYAYVNFYQRADAERALATLNCELLMGNPMRVMWSQRDSTMRKSGIGNLFIKNLDLEKIDSMALFDLFSVFGKILGANLAKEKLNGKLLNGHKVSIQHFKSRKEHETERNHHTQVFINKQKTLLRPEHQDNPVHHNVQRIKNVQTQNMTPFTPSQKVERNKENAPAVNTVPAVEERTTVDEKPALPQVPAVEQSPALPQVPAVEQGPAPPQVPAVEQSPAPPHLTGVEQSPALPQVPAVEQSPAPSHVPAVEQSPAPSHVPDVQDVSMAAAPQKRLTIYMLESADFEMQIQMAHDHLLPLVEKIHPAEANKISWMLIGSKNNFEIMNMISDPDLLRAKVDEMNMILKTGEAGVKSETKMLFGTKKKRKNKKKKIYL